MPPRPALPTPRRLSRREARYRFAGHAQSLASALRREVDRGAAGSGGRRCDGRCSTPVARRPLQVFSNSVRDLFRGAAQPVAVNERFTGLPDGAADRVRASLGQCEPNGEACITVARQTEAVRAPTHAGVTTRYRCAAAEWSAQVVTADQAPRVALTVSDLDGAGPLCIARAKDEVDPPYTGWSDNANAPHPCPSVAG